MTFRSSVLAAGTAMTCALVVLWPAPTWAEEISDSERMGEPTEDGYKFGEIAIRAELVADAKVPGGWLLVRTISNESDERQTATVEERIMRADSQLGARVDGTPEVASVTMRTFTLEPHQKKSIGITLPESIGKAITAGQLTRAAAARAQANMWATDKGPSPAQRAAYDRTYAVYFPQYLKALPPGATAESVAYRHGPGRMPDGPSLVSDPPAVEDEKPAPRIAAAPSRGLK